MPSPESMLSPADSLSLLNGCIGMLVAGEKQIHKILYRFLEIYSRVQNRLPWSLQHLVISAKQGIKNWSHGPQCKQHPNVAVKEFQIRLQKMAAMVAGANETNWKLRQICVHGQYFIVPPASSTMWNKTLSLWPLTGPPAHPTSIKSKRQGDSR